MSRPYLYLFFLFCFLVLSHSGDSQPIRDGNSKLMVRIKGGEIRDSNSRKIGAVYYDGVVRNSSGKKLGSIHDGKVVDDNGATIFKYDGSGTIRDKNGRMLYKIGVSEIRNYSGKLMLKYERIELTYIIGYLCFFQ